MILLVPTRMVELTKKAEGWLSGAREGRKRGLWLHGHKVQFGKMERFYRWIMVQNIYITEGH